MSSTENVEPLKGETKKKKGVDSQPNDGGVVYFFFNAVWLQIVSFFNAWWEHIVSFFNVNTFICVHRFPNIILAQTVTELLKNPLLDNILQLDRGNIQSAGAFFLKNKFALLPNALDHATVNKWAKASKELLVKHGIPIERKVSGKPLSYIVVPGEIIRQHAAEIYRFYRGHAMRSLVRRVTGATQIYVSQHLRSSVNINYLRKPRQVYRWHFDAELYTSILFLTSLNREDGGALQIRPPKNSNHGKSSTRQEPSSGGGIRTVRPQAGSLVIMDGCKCSHSVAPLRRECDRITLVMVYPNFLGRPRPEKLDDYLYDSGIADEAFHGDPNLPGS